MNSLARLPQVRGVGVMCLGATREHLHLLVLVFPFHSMQMTGTLVRSREHH